MAFKAVAIYVSAHGRTVLAACLIGLVASCQGFCPTKGGSASALDAQYRAVSPVGVDPIVLLPEHVISVGLQVPESQKLLDLLPNETVAISISSYSESGSISFGPAAVTKKRNSYTVSVDYIRFQSDGLQSQLAIGAVSQSDANQNMARIGYTIGVGLRLTASLVALEDGVSLTNLSQLGIAAQEGRVAGVLSVQTMGIYGPTITPLVPMPAELSTAAIQAAIQSLAAIKAKVHGDTGISPQVISVDLSESPTLSVFDAVQTVRQHLKTISERRRQSIVPVPEGSSTKGVDATGATEGGGGE